MALSSIYPEAVVRINPIISERLGLKNGDIVSVSTKFGTLTLPVVFDTAVNESSVMLTNCFEGRGAFTLLGYNLDPITMAPGIEGCEVTIQKI